MLVTDLWILAAGVLCIGLTFIPSPTLQTFVILALWLALLAVFVLAVIVVILASIGLYRASRLGGYRRGTALASLFGGIALLFSPVAVLTLATILSSVPR